jgi:hypothetical protein
MNNSPTDLFLNKVGSPPFKLCEIRIQLRSSGIAHHVLPYRLGFESLQYRILDRLPAFYRKVICFLLDKSEEDFPILFSRWI